MIGMHELRQMAQLETKYAQLETINAELLHAAEDVSRLLKYFVVTSEHFQFAIERLRAAIAKAKKEQP